MPKTNIIDLHGQSVKEAETIIRQETTNCYYNHIKSVRFITGRGNHVNSNGSRAVLFNLLPVFMRSKDLSPFVKKVIPLDGSYVVNFDEPESSVMRLRQKSRKAFIVKMKTPKSL